LNFIFFIELMSAGSQQWIVEELALYLTLTIKSHKVVRSVNKNFHIIADQIAQYEWIFNNLNSLQDFNNISKITLHKLQYLQQMGCPWNVWTTMYIAKYGHLDCLKYAHENDCPWNEWTTKYAAENGHLDCLKYAHENGCPWNKWTTTYATTYGHLDCLKYAHENGCPWNVDNRNCQITTWAAKNGYLDCLKYAHENGCPWDKWTTTYAAVFGYLDCLQYAVENGCPLSNNIPENSYFECRQYLQSLQS
jgi:hypothetical protein